MPARRIGDLYELPGLGAGRFFMQHVDNDASQLGSHVVRVFTGIEAASVITPEKIVQQPTQFFVHVLLRAGETLAMWQKVGRATVIDPLGDLTWRTCPMDEMRQPCATEWRVWRTNGERKMALPGSTSLRGTEVGMVIAPASVVERAHTGKWSFPYPDWTRN